MSKTSSSVHVPAVPDISQKQPQPVRCTCRGCGRLLFKSNLAPGMWTEIKCYACNTMNLFDVPRKEAA